MKRLLVLTLIPATLACLWMLGCEGDPTGPQIEITGDGNDVTFVDSDITGDNSGDIDTNSPPPCCPSSSPPPTTTTRSAGSSTFIP